MSVQKMPDRVRLLRKNAGLTQEEVAKRLGVSTAVVSHWETGYREPSIGILRQLANLLSVKMDDLYAGEPIPVGHACPFCGSKVTQVESVDGEFFTVCEICEATGPRAPSANMAIHAGRARGNCMELGGMEFTD